MMRAFYVRSAHSEILHWRQHSLAPLGKSDALRYEPTIVTAGLVISSPLLVDVTSDGVRWDARPAPQVIAEGVRGRDRVHRYVAPPTGETRWQQWPGCAYLDLFPVEEGSIVGEIVRVRRPDTLNADVQFEKTGYCRFEIRPLSDVIARSRLIVHERTQGDAWSRIDRGVVGASGRLEQIHKAQQGAFALVDERGELLALRAFGFGDLVPETSVALRRELAPFYPVEPDHHEWEDWPLWMREVFVEPLAGYFAPGVTQTVADQLRVAARRSLFGRFLPSCREWRPEVTVEAFVAERWPQMRDVLTLGLSTDGFADAFAHRSSPTLSEAMMMAAGSPRLVTEYLRVADISLQARRVEPLLPAGSEARDLVQRLRVALDDIARGRSGAAEDARRLWALLETEIQKLTGGPVGQLDEAAAEDFRWAAAQQTFADAHFVPLTSTHPLERAGDIVKHLQTSDAAAICTHVDEALDTGLLSPEVGAEIAGREQNIASALAEVCAVVPPRHASRGALVIAALAKARDDRAVVRALAARTLEARIRDGVATAINARRSQLANAPTWLSSAEPSLEAYLSGALAYGNLLTRLVQEERQRQADVHLAERERESRLQEVAPWLPPGIDVESQDALEVLRAKVNALFDRASSLQGELTAGKAKTAAAAAMDAIQSAWSGAGDAVALARILTAQTGTVEAVEKRFTAATRGADTAAARKWYQEKGLQGMRTAIRAEQEANLLLWGPLDPPLSELLWLSDDEYLLMHGPRLAVSAKSIALLASIDDLERLQREVAALRAHITAAHGNPTALRLKLIEIRERRWEDLVTDLCAAGAIQRPLALMYFEGALRAAGASTYGVDGPSIRASARCDELRMSETELRRQLIQIRLWPGATTEAHV